MRKKQLNVFLTTILMVASMSVYALNKVDGVYQIATSEDLKAFAELVNGGEVNANAVLVANIDKGTENYRIGRNGQDYQGIFDGNGHTIIYNMTFDEDGAALFRNVGAQAVIQNLKVQGTINTNSSFAGSIAGWNSGRIVGCYADVTINSSKEGGANHGGLVGRGYLGTVIENCLVKVAIKGEKSQNCGGVVGWTSDKINIVNTLVVSKGSTLDFSSGTCCNIACCPSINNASNVVTKNVYVVNPISNGYGRDGDKYIFYENEEGVTNGELAFLLNSKQNGLDRFYQVIGTDPMPVPLKKEGGRIYVSASEFCCDGSPKDETTFGNTYTSDPVIPDHQFVDGWCTVCGQMDENFMTPVDGWLNISNGAQLKWWSAYAFMHEDSKVRLTADINMSGYCEGYTPPQIFVGQFDGQGHVISNFIIDSGNDYQGLIGIVGNGAVIKNFTLDNTCSITGSNWCGVIGGTNGSGDIYIDRIGNEGTVITINSYAGGILGADMQGSMNLHITNCYVTGTIDGGRESAAICGYSNTNSEVTNCWSTATIPEYSIYSSDSFTRGPAKVTNCYEAAIEGVDANKQQHINPIAEDRRVNPITLEDVANGALCYKLNESKQGGENFYQVIGTDPIPLPFAKEGGKVYSHGNSVYANTPPVKLEGTWIDSNGTEWYFTTNEGNAIISSRGWDDVNSCNIPSISGTIPTNLTIPSIVYIGETSYTVTSIGFDAFHGCSSLTSVTIAKGVTSIEALAFYGCSSLKSITIPEGITSIGNGAFRDCSNLAAITIPEGVTSIEALAFYGCSSLKSINIPDGVNSIGGGTFRDCSSLESIAIPDGVTSIGDEAFLGCSSLTSVIIPDGVSSIGRGAFWNCSSLTSISIPKNVTSIGVSMFQGCSSLSSIIIPDGLTSIGGWAFYECSNLISITIPENVSSIGAGAFVGCSNLTSIIVCMQTPIDLSMNSSTFENCNTATLYVPKGSKVAYQEADVWKDFKNILGYNNVDTSQDPPIINGEGIWTDANGTEWYFTTEKSNATISSRGWDDVNSCYIPTISGTIPTELTIPSTVYIGETPYSVTAIEGRAFSGCSNFTSVIIPESFTSIGESAFANCYSLTSINIPDGVTSIGNGAFFRCSNLTSINIPDAVTSIGKEAFSGCSSLTSITISNGVTSIGRGSFYNCSNLTFITLPVGVTSIEQGTFGNCSNLTSINIPDGVTSIGTGSFEGCSSLTSIVIPESVTSIGESAFASCYSLTTITIPNGVTSIGTSVFIRSGLTSITIPESVTSIGECAFEECPYLNTVTVNAVTPPACAEEAFSNAANCMLNVPYGTGDAYATATGWQDFKEIIECDPEGTDISQLNNAIYIEPFAVKVGENAQMQICLKNADAATAYVFDLVLPEGITVAKNDKGKYIDELSDRHNDHTRTFNYKGNNTYSLSTLSGNSEQLTGNDGPIRLVTIEASDNMVEGNYAIEIKNASYSKPDGTLVSLPDTRAVVTVEDYVLGDVNGNGGVDIGDAVSIVNYLVGKDSSIFVAKAADTNKNGQIDIGDAVTIVNLLVGKITNFTREFNIIWDEKEPE